MPPQPQIATASRSSGFLRGLLYVTIGLCVGIALTLGGVYVAAQSPMGRQVVANYFVVKALATVPSEQISNVPPVSVTSLSATSTVVYVPKKYATEDYYKSINVTISTYNALIVTGEKMAVLMAQINKKSISGDYTGLFDLVVEMKGLLSQSARLASEFSQGLTALSVANGATTDAQTKSLTQTTVSLGNTLQASLSTYFSLVNNLLSGSVPTGTQISQTVAQSEQVQSQGAAFQVAVQALLTRIQTGFSTNTQ